MTKPLAEPTPTRTDDFYDGMPCASAPLTWSSTDLQSHAVARAGCLRCPAIRPCRAMAFGEAVATGTFGGDLYLNGIPSVVYA